MKWISAIGARSPTRIGRENPVKQLGNEEKRPANKQEQVHGDEERAGVVDSFINVSENPNENSSSRREIPIRPQDSETR